ncbi:MAG: amino acid permease [Saprospiraceae bacterium]|nr:amino acid permease [Saprospiraceae bacterium]
MSKLKRQLTLSGLTMIAIGSCIGSGIFITPADSLARLPHQGWVLFVWALGGVVAYLGALTFSELGSRFPGAGGVYVYIKEAYGPLPAFLYGWIILLIVNTGALAALAYALVDYLNFFFPLAGSLKTGLAIVIIILLTIINVLGVKTSQFVATLFTSLKLLAIFFIILVGFWYAGTADHSINWKLTGDVPEGLLSGMLLAFVGVFWSTGGWHHATYLAGETIEPQKNVPKAMMYGTITVTVTYLLVILSFMLLVPMQEMAQSERIAGDALQSVFTWGGRIVSIMISISIFGTIAIYTMSAPRIYFAMAEDKLFFKFLAQTHPKYKTPHYAMILQSTWAIILILLWGSFIRIITFVTFMDILFMAIAASTIFIIRKKAKEAAPFKLKWYPWIPLSYLTVTVAFVLNTAWNLRAESLAGIVILLAGFPCYWWFYNKKQQ